MQVIKNSDYEFGNQSKKNTFTVIFISAAKLVIVIFKVKVQQTGHLVLLIKWQSLQAHGF